MSREVGNSTSRALPCGDDREQCVHRMSGLFHFFFANPLMESGMLLGIGAMVTGEEQLDTSCCRNNTLKWVNLIQLVFSWKLITNDFELVRFCWGFS